MSGSMSWVDAAGRCVGFFIYRGKLGYEAFDGDEKSLGLFPSQDAAAAAILKRGISNDEGICK
jgi:hypothetical protein